MLTNVVLGHVGNNIITITIINIASLPFVILLFAITNFEHPLTQFYLLHYLAFYFYNLHFLSLHLRIFHFYVVHFQLVAFTFCKRCTPKNVKISVSVSGAEIIRKQVGLEVPHLKSKFQSGEYSTRRIYMVGG